MYYRVKVKDHVRVSPERLGEDVSAGIINEVKAKFNGFISKDLGVVVEVSSVEKIGEGVIIMGDGGVYYDTEFTLIVFQPELKEIMIGRVKDIADFGVFFSMGPVDGMIHISQAMNDYVSFSKDKALLGKETKRTLKIGDKCLAKVIAVSFKDQLNPRFGLTMRQPGLGKLEWVSEDLSKKK
ncbi:MAG: DNA-directed RNA polymerase [Candidatus Woesearchaeota archaeon]|nr:MAG: DNA-directed RNA polymerase [Candidatus Woesearchaeota archaeon]